LIQRKVRQGRKGHEGILVRFAHRAGALESAEGRKSILVIFASLASFALNR
jgi:heme-degrading monooxygenase HmoA